MRTEYLVRKAQRGSKDAFVKLIESHEAALYRVARAFLSRKQDLEDAVQEAVCRAFSKLPDLRDPGLFDTWLTRIMINCCVDLQRLQRGSFPIDVLPVDDPNRTWDEFTREEESWDVRQALSELSENDQLILTLFYLNELSIREIAQILSIKENAVKQRLYRGRQRFEKIYLQHEEEGGAL